MVIADTGYFVAIADRNDPFHAAAKAASSKLRESLVTTWPVATETSHILLKRLGATQLVRFLETYAAKLFHIFDLNAGHVPRMQTLMRDYADLPMDLADASLVILAEHLNDGRILSTDLRDFRTYRWKNRRPFENLLVPG
jgi:hypothetical protein